MNVDFLIKINPFNIPGVQIPKTSDGETKKTETASQAAASQNRASGANFVQKIKDTNDAVGFIQTAEAFLSKLDKEGVNSFDGASELAKSFSYAQKPVMSKQNFDTTAGVVQVDIGSSELGFGSDFESWKSSAKELLKSKKAQISNPLAAFGAQKKEQMESAAERINLTNTNNKLGSLLDDINESLNKFEQKANDLGNTLF